MGRRRIIIAFVVVLLLVLAALWWRQAPVVQEQPSPPEQTTQVYYACNDGKSLAATLYSGGPAPAVIPGQPPTPTGRADVVLSDGRTFTLSQTLSADGVRYSNGDPMVAGDESFVFWSKGNTALVLENNVEKSYTGCVSVTPDPGGLPQVFHSDRFDVTARYPAGWTADQNYTYDQRGPNAPAIPGVKFHVPDTVASGTNLSAFDTGVSIEELSATSTCNASTFLAASTTPVMEERGGHEYSVASTTEAAAGNRYEEYVYAFTGSKPCVAVRYLVHYGVLENYPEGTVRAFDRGSLLHTFDMIRDTVTLGS